MSNTVITLWGAYSTSGSSTTNIYNTSEDFRANQDLDTVSDVHFKSLALTQALDVSSGGTGSVSAAGARTNLGVGTIATQAADNVAITGGSATLASLDAATATLGALSMGNHQITGLLEPTAADHAASKGYVDLAVAGLTIKQPVRCATTAALPNAEAVDLQTIVVKGAMSGFIGLIDGVTVAVGDRILVKDAADPKQNGIFEVLRIGDEFENWLLERPDDARSSATVSGGLLAFVQEGSTNGNGAWALTSPDGDAVLGTDALVFQQFSAFTYSATGGIQATGRVFHPHYGTTANTICQGDDSRLSNARQCDNTFVNAPTARSNLGLTAVATNAMPGSGYVKSNGTALSSVSTIPASDITGLSAYDPSAVAITGGNARLTFLETAAGTHPGGTQHIGLLTGSHTRFALGLEGAEAGSNSGSNFGLYRYNDTPAWLGTCVRISRATGLVELPQPSAGASDNLAWSGGGTTLGVLGYSGGGTHGYLDVRNAGSAADGIILRGSGNSSFGTGRTLSLNGTNATTRPLTIYSTSSRPALQITTDTSTGLGGAHIYTDRTSQCLVTGGGVYDAPAGGWMAGATSASGVDMSDGAVQMFCNTGLTAGSGFTPDYCASFTGTTASVNGSLRYFASGGGYYPIGTPSAYSTLRMFRCRLSMGNTCTDLDGVGITANFTNVGQAVIDYTSCGFSTTPTITATILYHAGASPLSAAARVNTAGTYTDKFCMIETFNCGTSYAIDLDAYGLRIECDVVLFGR